MTLQLAFDLQLEPFRVVGLGKWKGYLRADKYFKNVSQSKDTPVFAPRILGLLSLGEVEGLCA
jgi:hypothetical protein